MIFIVFSPYPSLKSIFWLHKTNSDSLFDMTKYDDARVHSDIMTIVKKVVGFEVVI